MNKYLYKIKDLEIPTHLKYWFARKSKINFDLSKILNGTSFDLTDTVNKKLHLINIFGNSIQNGEPTPENPIEIKSSGDNGYITEKIVNKNLFDIEKIIRGKVLDTTTGEVIEREDTKWCTTDFINVSSKKVFTLSGEIVPRSWQLRVVGYDKNKHYINGFALEYYNKRTITFDEEVSYIRITFYNQNLEQFIQLETGSTATDYETHQEQTHTIPCQQPMRAIGDVKDTFVKVNGVWYERHYISRILSYNGEEITTAYMSTTGQLSTGATIDYALETPLDLPCTQTQITALETLMKARTYKNITHIYSEDEVSADLEIQYYKEKGE